MDGMKSYHEFQGILHVSHSTAFFGMGMSVAWLLDGEGFWSRFRSFWLLQSVQYSLPVYSTGAVLCVGILGCMLNCMLRVFFSVGIEQRQPRGSSWLKKTCRIVHKGFVIAPDSQ